jgi:hypothetical protein
MGMDGSCFEQPCPHQQAVFVAQPPADSAASHSFGLGQQAPSDKELHEQPAGFGQQTVVTAAAAGGFCGLQCLEQTAGSLGPELSHLRAAPFAKKIDIVDDCDCELDCGDGDSVRSDGHSECSENQAKKMGTKRGREEIENEIEPDETGSLEADDGSQPTKRAKMDQMPSNAYEQERLERIRQNNEARRLPNFRLHWRLALSRARAPNPSALPMCRTHLLQLLDAQKVGESHAKMQAAPRARAPKKLPNGLPTRRSNRLLEIAAGPSFVHDEYKDGSVVICTVRVQPAPSCGPPPATRSRLRSVRTSCIGR